MKTFKTFLEQLHLEIYNEGLDDKWMRDDVTVTLKQLLDVTKNIPVENIPTDSCNIFCKNRNDVTKMQMQLSNALFFVY